MVVPESLIEFWGDMPIVAHNAPFDVSFLNEAFARCEFSTLTCPMIDTLAIAKRLHKNLISYRLKALAVHFELDILQLDLGEYPFHRSMGDCQLTYLLYKKLMDFDGCSE